MPALVIRLIRENYFEPGTLLKFSVFFERSPNRDEPIHSKRSQGRLWSLVFLIHWILFVDRKGEVDCHFLYRFFFFKLDTIFRIRFASTQILESKLISVLLQFLKTIKAISGISHHVTRLLYIPKASANFKRSTTRSIGSVVSEFLLVLIIFCAIVIFLSLFILRSVRSSSNYCTLCLIDSQWIRTVA